jgi:ribonuclease R
MLPEKLSNGLCSLNPQVDRLTMVCEMTMDPDGQITKFQFYEGIIYSHSRLTYTQVAAMPTNPHHRLN